MPKIPSFRRRRLPSVNVGAAPINVNPAIGTAETQGLAQLGKGISSFALSMFKIGETNRKSKDLLAESELKNDIKAAELDYRTLTEGDGDTSNWPDYYKQSVGKVTSKSREWGNKRSEQLADKMTTGWADIFSKQSELGIVKRNKNDAIAVTKTDYISSLSLLDDSETQGVLTGRAEDAYREALGTTFSPDKVDLLVSEAKVAGIKGKAINLAAAGDYSGARKLAGTIPQEEKELLSHINSLEAMKEKEGSDLNQILQEKVMTETVNQMMATPNDVGIEQIEASGLSDQNKNILTGAIQHRTEQLKEGRDPWVESSTNKAFTSAISSALDGSRAEVVKITVPDILKQLGNITPNQAGELINKRTRRLDSDDVTNRPAYKNATSSLNRLRTELQKGAANKEEFETFESDMLDINNELLKYADTIANDPDFDSKITKKRFELTKPVQNEQAEGRWSKFWSNAGVDIPQDATVNPLRRLPNFFSIAYNLFVLEPDNQAEFDKTVIELKLTDPEKARKYYNRHKGLWPERYE